MARPKKQGLDYFPLDCDIFEDEKFFDLQNEYGPLGEVIYLRLLCMVYHSGYYYRFDSLEKLASMLIRSIGNRWARDKRTVVEVILFLAKINLFSAELMQEHVITSRGIQERYLTATERRQTEIREYNLLEKIAPHEGVFAVPENSVIATETGVIVTETPVNVCNNATKESKGKEIKEKESRAEESTRACGTSNTARTTKKALIERYGENRVSEYEERYERWAAKQTRPVRGNKHEIIGRWMEQDGVTKPDNCSSIDMDMALSQLMGQYNEEET